MPKLGMHATRHSPHAARDGRLTRSCTHNRSGLLFRRNARLLLVEGAARDLGCGGPCKPAPHPRLPLRFMPMLGVSAAAGALLLAKAVGLHVILTFL